MRSILRSRGPWALALILALALQTTFADHHGDYGDDKKPEQEHKDEDYQKLSKRLDTITARLKHIDIHLEKRLSPKIRQKALSLEHRLEELEDDHCDKEHYDCGGQDHECVSRLMVCDGHRDCRNGDDEKHCSLPTNTGDRFVGYKVYDNCDEGHMDKATLTITEVKVRPAYPAFPYVRAVISSADEKGDHVEVAYHMVGYYRFNTHKLVLLPPQGSQGSESSGVVCEFDGHDPDKCVAHVVSQVSLSRCAEFVFFRQKGNKGNKRHH